MQLTLWTYEGPPHVGAMRVATAMEKVHYVLHAPQGDTYADLLFTMIERLQKRPPVTYTTFQARDLGGDTAELFKTAAREAYERFQPQAMLVGASCTAELIQDDPGGLCKALNLPVPVVALELPTPALGIARLAENGDVLLAGIAEFRPLFHLPQHTFQRDDLHRLELSFLAQRGLQQLHRRGLLGLVHLLQRQSAAGLGGEAEVLPLIPVEGKCRLAPLGLVERAEEGVGRGFHRRDRRKILRGERQAEQEGKQRGSHRGDTTSQTPRFSQGCVSAAGHGLLAARCRFVATACCGVRPGLVSRLTKRKRQQAARS